jgi:Ni/Co efflux regulator RcnB
MLKTISAALLAVSVLAAPALAAGTDKTAQAPVTKSVQTKASVVNSNAKMGRHHVRHASHHRFHKKMATHKTHRSSKIAAKHVTLPAKRG